MDFGPAFGFRCLPVLSAPCLSVAWAWPSSHRVLMLPCSTFFCACFWGFLNFFNCRMCLSARRTTCASIHAATQLMDFWIRTLLLLAFRRLRTWILNSCAITNQTVGTLSFAAQKFCYCARQGKWEVLCPRHCPPHSQVPTDTSGWIILSFDSTLG